MPKTPTKRSPAKSPAEEPPNSAGVEHVARLIGDVLRLASIQETPAGRVARALLRARENGDLEAMDRFGTPFISLITRGIESDATEIKLDFSDEELKQLESLTTGTVARDYHTSKASEAAFALRMTLPHEIAELSDHEVVHVREYLDVLQTNEGTVTPIEDFIVNLPWQWKLAASHGDGLTPDKIIEDLIDGPDGCRLWFDEAVTSTRYFNRMYPKLVAKEQKTDEKEQLA